MQYTFSDRISSLKPSAIREILKATSQPGVIPFAAGNPSAEAFPVEEVRRISKDIFENDPILALQYGITEGYEPLRKRILGYVKEKHNISRDFDNIIITSGAQQVMDLTSKVFLNEGDTVICETPSFIGSLNCFRSYRAKLCGVPIDSDGMNIEKLEEALKNNKNAKFIYTIPNFQNPSGATMSLEKRKALYALAKQYGALILEDNPYGDLRVAGEDIPNIKSFDEDGIVIYSGSFSKILSPGLRVGYVVAHQDIISKMTVGKQTQDVHTPIFNQLVVDRWMAEYDFEKHIEKIRGIYKAKLDLMCSLVDEELGDFVKYVRPEGGLFVWCELPEEIDMLDFCKRAVEKKVAVVPGTAFTMDENDKTNCFRMNFSTPSDEMIVEGMKRLGEVKRSYKNG
ncbi:MAG: PLP-dependent aminotransferase family protein [Clostridia bacterium]|nr:PLP-dependent aminotransferase family protein [Clostridia bacterium]